MNKNQACKNLISQKTGGMAFSLMMIAFLFVTLIGRVVLLALGVDSGLIFQAVSGCFSSIAIVCVFLLLSTRDKISLKYLSGINKFNPLYLLLALLFSASMFFGLGFFNNSVVIFLQSIGLNAGGSSLELDSTISLIVFLIVFAVLPAFFEEIFFRGLINNSLENAGIIVSALVGGLFFGLYHTSLSKFFYQFIYGVGLMLIVRLSGSVISCMIAHFINNAIVIFFIYFKVVINFYNGFVIAGGLFGLLIFVAVVFCLIKKTTDIKKEKTAEFFIGGLIGGAVCILLIVTALLG